ncbi:hypothetical protein Lal_00042569 [Lupinus albus]|nr:hypothetical protein Lal_00042569 [Lupinus albus]
MTFWALQVEDVFVFHLLPPPNSVLLLPPWKARVRQNRTLDTNFVSVSEHPVAENTTSKHSVSVHSEYSDFVHSVPFPNFDHSVHSENMPQTPTLPGPRQRTLKELPRTSDHPEAYAANIYNNRPPYQQQHYDPPSSKHIQSWLEKSGTISEQ